MKGLSFRARVYISSVLIPAAGVLFWNLSFLPQGRDEWLLFGILTAFAAASQLFPVLTSKNQSYELTPIAFFAALLLLPTGALSLLIVLAFIPEWIKARKLWYIQLFNIAIHLLQAYLARALYLMAERMASGLGPELANVIALILAVALFTAVNHALLAIVLHLARDRSWKETHLFELEYFLVDAALASTGAIAASVWQVNPWLVALISAPLLLIYRGLNTPNLQELARTDAKTGLYNARHFYQVLQNELRRTARFERPVAVVMADMDLLRNINNSYGHLAGDIVLKGVADILRRDLREYDLAARFGGEEFAILLPENDADQALAVAERIRKQVEEARFAVPTSLEPIKATLSLGVAVFPDHGSTVDEVIHQADLAVYYSKLQGRNRVWAASPESRALGPSMAGQRDMDYALREASEGRSPKYNQEVRDGVITTAAAEVLIPGTTVDGASSTSLGAGVPLVTHDSAAPTFADGQGQSEDTLSQKSRLSPRLVPLFIAAVVATAVALWAIYRPLDAQLDWPGLAVLAVLTVGAQTLFIEIYGRGKISTSAIPLLAGGFLFGIPAALLLAPLIPATVWVRTRGRIHRILFDAGDTTISAVTAAAVFYGVASRLPSSEPILLLVPAGVAAVAYYVVNVGLISVAIGLEDSRAPFEVWKEKFRWLLLHYVVFGLLALLMVLAYKAIGVYGLASFFVPPVMLRFVMKQYVDRTEANVAELKRVNEELRRTHDRVVRTLEELRVTYDSTLVALSTALDSRDSNTEGHSRRVIGYVLSIARELGLGQAEVSSMLNGALLHDVGKIGVPDAILNKNGELTPEERIIMRQHPEIGFRMLQHIGFLKDALPLVRHHHESFDGTGYPDQLGGDQIPLSARIFAVADTFDAMTSDRPYRSALGMQEALSEIARCTGTQFDPRVVEAFLRIDVAELSASPDSPAALRLLTPHEHGAEAAPSPPQTSPQSA